MLVNQYMPVICAIQTINSVGGHRLCVRRDGWNGPNSNIA